MLKQVILCGLLNSFCSKTKPIAAKFDKESYLKTLRKTITENGKRMLPPGRKLTDKLRDYNPIKFIIILFYGFEMK